MRGEGWPRAEERRAQTSSSCAHRGPAPARSAQCAPRPARSGDSVLRKPAARAVISWQMPKEPDLSSLRLQRLPLQVLEI